MKNTLLSIAMLMILPTAAQAYDFDGCYQLYQPSVMYPAFCLSGTNEESIGGAGARVVIFGTNTNIVVACGMSSELKITNDSFEFVQNGRSEIILKDLSLSPQEKNLEGDAVFGKSQLKFMKLSRVTSNRLQKEFAKETRCEGLQPGELRSFKR